MMVSAYIQWKGTDVCMDLHCDCGVHSHFDGGFAYAVRCPACNAVYRMPDTVKPERIADDVEPDAIEHDGVVVVTAEP